jgi:Asp-tRNA(Asn)/Glu-tRNA(Gln) amidotransferase A subunit family amidase
MNLPWTFCGVPTIAAPWLKMNDLPLGVQCATVHNADEELWEIVNILASELD